MGSRSCGTGASFSGRQIAQPQTVLSTPADRPRSRKRTYRRSLTCVAAVEGHLVHSRFPGFFEDDELELSESSIVTPRSSSWGLNTSQMRALGITNDTQVRREIDPESIRAVNFYGGDKVMANTREEVRMAAGTGAAPGQVPPDLPSLLLDARICYIGMPLVPAVTELVISELLWLNYSNPEKPVYLYVHSYGSQTPDGQVRTFSVLNVTSTAPKGERRGTPPVIAIGFETEAYALLDTMAYIKPPVYTLVVGEAMGNAAMLVASGRKGNRFALPHSRMMTCPPRMNRSFGSTVNMMIRAEDLEYNTQRYVDHMSKYTSKPKDVVRKDVGRNRYFSPKQAIEYGLIDHIVTKKGSGKVMDKQDYEGVLRQSQVQKPRQAAAAGASPDAGY